MKIFTTFLILLFILPVFFFSCSPGVQVTEKYLHHVKQVYSIILKHPENADTAAGEVYEYVQKHQKEIEDTLKQMEQLSVKETEKVYLGVEREVDKLFNYIKTHTTDEYPLGVQEKLGLALQILYN